jgi:MFS family permease
MGSTALYWLTLKVAHGQAVALSAVVAARFLPMLVASRRAGMIVARNQAVRVVVITQFLQAAGSLAIGVALLVGWISVWYVVLVTFGIGCAVSVDVPARQTLMLNLVGNSELRKGTSLYATITGLSKIIGPGIAGVIIAATGETAVFFIDAASFLGVIVVVAILSKSPMSSVSGTASPSEAKRLRWVLDLPRPVHAVIAMALLIGAFGLQFSVVNPLMATKIFHLGSVGFGLIGTSIAIGGIVGNFYSSRRPDPGASEFLIWSAVFGAAECAAALMPDVISYDIVMFIIGAATQLFAVSSTVYLQQSTPKNQRAHGLSAYNAAFMGFVPVGSFAIAGVAATLGTRWALFGPGLGILIGATGVLISRRQPYLGRSASTSSSEPRQESPPAAQ